MTEQPSLQAAGWGWRHPGREAWAIRGVDLTVPSGQIVLVAGNSGAGKSTLLHGLAGVLDVEEGEGEGTLTIGGQPVTSPPARGWVGMVQQDPESQRVMGRIGDEVAFGLENLGVPPSQIWPRVAEAIRTVGLRYSLEHPTSHLSGGEKQRLALACALAMQPRVILLDEPTANLDSDAAIEVRQAATELARTTNATLIVVDHNMAPWLPNADRLLVLREGSIVADGAPNEVIADHGPLLEEAGVWLPGRDPLDFLDAGGSGRAPSPDRFEQIAVETDDLTVGYEDGPPVLSQLNLRFVQGMSACITGPNGVGKTTLALTVAGLLRPQEGAVIVSPSIVEGTADRKVPQGSDPFRWSAPELLGRISMVFQEPQYQFLTGSVEEELSLGPRLAGQSDSEIRERVERYLGLLRLRRLREAHPMSLSGGERRRLAVAVALIAAPELVVLDEPTFGQDFNTWVDLVNLLLEAKSRGTTLITITHDPDLVRALGEDVIEVSPPLEADTSAENRHGGGAGTRRALPPHRRPRRVGLLKRVNPATQILALLVMTVPLLTTIDPVSAGVALALELLLVPLTGIRPRQFLLRISPLLVAAPLAAVSMLLYASPSGTIYAQWGPATISENSVLMATSIALRVLAVGVPAVVILPSLGSTEVADSLTQIVRLPARFVLSSLAAVRMVGLMLSDWKALGRARRSRGMKGTHFVRAAFSLMTFALRRADSLSVSMEARGFGAATARTNARHSGLSGADAVMLAASAAIPIVALGAANVLGTFTWFGVK